LREADEEFSALRQVIDGLTEPEMLQVWLGSWSIREILVHISGWHQAMALAFERIARGEEPYPAGTYDDFDAWNARFVEAKTGVKLADVLAELVDSERDFVKAAAAVPEALFAPGGAARDLFEGAGPGHYREHIGQIREWRSGLRR
jgi:hypothetical protein